MPSSLKFGVIVFCYFMAASLSAQNDKHLAVLDSLDRYYEQEDFSSISKSIFNRLQEEWYEMDDWNVGFQSFFDLAVAQFGEQHRIPALILHKYAVALYLDYNEQGAVEKLKQAVQIRQAVLGATHPDLERSLNLMGRCQYELDDLDGAIFSYKMAIDIANAVPLLQRQIENHRRIARVYESLEEFELAAAHMQLASKLNEKHFPGDFRSQGRLLFNLAIVQQEIQEQLRDAILNYKKAIRLLEDSENTDLPDYQAALVNLGIVYLDNQEDQNAFKTLNQALNFHLEKEDSTYLGEIYESLGAYYKRQGQYEKAIEEYEKVYAIRQLEQEGKSLDLNYVYHNFGEIYELQGDFSQAANYYQKAIQQAVVEFNNDDIAQNPRSDDVDLTTSYADYIQDLDSKGRLFFKWFEESGDINKLKISLATYQLAIGLLYDKRAELISEADKIRWTASLYPVFERALQAAYLGHQNQLDVLPDVLDWLEKSKALVLLESLLEQQSRASFPGQDSLKSRITLQQEDLNQVRRIALQSGWTDSLEIHSLLSQIELWENIGQLNKLSKQNSSLTTSEVTISLATIQAELLGPNQMAILYYVGSDHVFGLGLSSRQSQFIAFSTEDFDQRIAKFRSLLVKPNSSPEKFQEFLEIGNKLYSQLLARILEETEGIEKLIVVPDSYLSSIPFEALVQDHPKDISTYYGPDVVDYLINDYDLSYAFSLGTLLQQQQVAIQKGKYNFYGTAPEFHGPPSLNNRRSCGELDQLSALIKSAEEVDAIQALYGGVVSKGVKASKDDFLQTGLKANILHLATHACVDDENPAASRLYFSDDYMYAHELYNLDLKARMVVLSACETGVGEFKKGEGIMSLARGFAISGAPSLTLSYWSVSDESTAEIMKYYYEHLKEGATKSSALKAAKLQYLNQQEQINRMHPFYWAAFVHIGDDQPLNLHKKGFPLGITLSLLVLILGLGTYFRYRTKNKN